MSNRAGHGRNADSPRHIPLSGWKDVLWRVGQELRDDRVPMLASSVAYYAMLALFPALLATVSLYGMLADPHEIARSVVRLMPALPDDARYMVIRELNRIASAPRGGLGFGFALSTLFALASASSGVLGLMDGVNVAYDEAETRGVLRQRLLAVAGAAGLSLFVVASVFLLTALPTVMHHVGLARQTRWLLSALRWPALAAVAMVGMACLYRYAPNRARPRWRWVTWGAAIATAIWLLASFLLSTYVHSFGKFERTYGALGAVIVMLVWFYISALAVLLGAELNAELEHQTTVDTTVGPDRPIGERGAVVADHVGDFMPDTNEPLRQRLVELGKTLMRPRRGK